MTQASLRSTEERSGSQQDSASIFGVQEAHDGSPPHSLGERPLLRKLLTMPPPNAARWVLDAVKRLECPPAGAERATVEPLLRLASEFKDAPLKEAKEKIVSAVVSGFLELPAKDRVDVVRMTLRIASGRKDELIAKGVLSLPYPAVQEAEDRALCNSATDEDIALLASVVNPKRANLAFFHLFMVVDRSGFDKYNAEIGFAMVGAAMRAFLSVPALTFVEVCAEHVTELDEVERKRLTIIVNEDDDFCASHQLFIAKAVEPGGYADQLLDVIRMGRGFTTYLFLLSLLAIGELLLAELLPRCGTPLNAWLFTDGVLWLLAVVSAWYLGLEIRPLVADYLQGVWSAIEQEFFATDADDDIEKAGVRTQRGSSEVPDKEDTSRIKIFQDAAWRLGTAAVICGLAFIAGFLASVVAIVEGIFGIGGCAASLMIFTALFAVLRIFLTVWLALWVWSLVQEFRLAYMLFFNLPQSSTEKSSSSTPIVKDEQAQYGSFA